MDRRNLPDAREEAATLTYEKLPWGEGDGPILVRETVEKFIRDIQYRTLMAVVEKFSASHKAPIDLYREYYNTGMTDAESIVYGLALSVKEGK